jgi:hypothetical protein
MVGSRRENMLTIKEAVIQEAIARDTRGTHSDLLIIGCGM